MKKVEFTETILRDANQSLIATRLPYEKFAPMLAEMDKAGFYSVECWGGATFDVCLRFLNEDPWERLRKIRAAMPNTKLQMLLRGQNILGYKHYSDDIVRRFVRASVRNGIDIIRIFDALNDTDNLKVAIEETVKSGAMASGAISYTTSPVHTLDKYVELAKEMAAMGVGSICIKDMAGIMTPQSCYDLVSALKDAVDLAGRAAYALHDGACLHDLPQGHRGRGRRYRHRHIPILRRYLAARDRDALLHP